MEQKGRRFVGLDFGVRTFEMCMYDENGKIVRSNGLTTPEGRQKLYSKLKPTDRVGIEMCSLTMKIAREMKCTVGCDVLLLHAGKLAVIYKSLKKTDKEDALKLARLVKTHEDEELPIVPLPSEVDLKRRRMIREAKQLRSDRTKEVNRLHALFVECGITNIKKKNLATKTSREKRTPFSAFLLLKAVSTSPDSERRRNAPSILFVRHFSEACGKSESPAGKSQTY